VVPKLFSAGKSFKGLGRYLTTDPKANSAERVAWTHTLNLANDHIPSAIDEMLWTYRAADMLKRQAGIPAGGRRLENPVKHFSLNFHRSEEPSREHMIGTVRDFLDHMGWADHQAVLVCHNDRHPHVHVMLNAVHPETGRALDTGFERRRAGEWALAYERENSQIFCEQRLRPKEEREPSPTREAWQKLKDAEQQHDKAEHERAARAPDYLTRGDRVLGEAKEWEALKSHQREERDDFFVGGKQAYKEVRNAIFREVRTEFCEDWKGYYEAKRQGLEAEPLAEMKADILARQNAELEARRTVACAELRERRDAEYEQLLLNQKHERAELAMRQDQGLRSPHLLGVVYGSAAEVPDSESYETIEPGGAEQHSRENARTGFGAAARKVCEPTPEVSPEAGDRGEADLFETPNHERTKVRDGLDIAGGLGLSALGVIAALGERLFDGFMGGAEQARPRPAPSADRPKPTVQGERKARAAEAQIRAAETQAAEAEQLQAYWQQRGRRRGRERD
jgi:hypothetical protein